MTIVRDFFNLRNFLRARYQSRHISVCNGQLRQDDSEHLSRRGATIHEYCPHPLHQNVILPAIDMAGPVQALVFWRFVCLTSSVSSSVSNSYSDSQCGLPPCETDVWSALPVPPCCYAHAGRHIQRVFACWHRLWQ